MSRRRALMAGLGVLIAAGGIFPSPGVRAQDENEAARCAAPNSSDEMRVEVSPLENPYVVPNIEINVVAKNLSTRKSIPTDNDPRITKITATLLRCREGQGLPEETTRSTNSPPSDEMTLNWPTGEFPTNGPYAVEVVVTGNRPGSPPQVSRVVAPFSLAVQPNRPDEVKREYDGSGVVISWSNEPRERDLVLYEVQRAAQGSGDYTTVTDGVVAASVNTLRDEPGPGAWRYRVFAVRRGATEAEGVRSAPSNDVTAEVAAPTTTTAGSGTSTSGSGPSSSTSTTASSSAGSPTSSGSRLRQGSGGSSSVDLSGLSSTSNGRRVRGSDADTGFNEILPFDPEAGPADELGSDDAEPVELGAEEPNQGVGQRLVSDDGERRRSLGFVAFGLLLFVLSMTGLFLKGEVKRADDLDPLDPTPPDEPQPDTAKPQADIAKPDPIVAATPMDPPIAVPDPLPEPLHVPDPVPEPLHVPDPVPEPLHVPDPVPEPLHVPDPVPEPLVPDPVPEPLHVPDPVPDPLVPDPSAVPSPVPEPDPIVAAARARILAESLRAAPEDFAAVPELVSFDDLIEPVVAPALPARRPRRTMAPTYAPSLDVPDPVAPAPRNTNRTETPSNARRTTPRLPSRPADDRPEGGAAVRPRRGRTGEGNRRVPLG